MSDPVPSTQFVVSESTRPVWVISTLKVPNGLSPLDFVYKEEFKGKQISIPPNGEKKVKMSWVHATSFLKQVNGFNDPFPNGGYVDQNGDVHPERFGKPLEILEMTPEERLSVDGLTQEQINAQKLLEEQEMKASKQGNESAIPVGDQLPTAAPKRGRPFSKQNDKEAERVLAASL